MSGKFGDLRFIGRQIIAQRQTTTEEARALFGGVQHVAVNRFIAGLGL